MSLVTQISVHVALLSITLEMDAHWKRFYCTLGRYIRQVHTWYYDIEPSNIDQRDNEKEPKYFHSSSSIADELSVLI